MGHVSGGIGKSSDFRRRTRKRLTSWGWAVSSSNLSFFVTGGVLRWYWYWDYIDIVCWCYSKWMVTLCVGRGRRTICNGFSLPENCTQIISLFLLQLFIFYFLTPAKFTIMPIFLFFPGTCFFHFFSLAFSRSVLSFLPLHLIVSVNQEPINNPYPTYGSFYPIIPLTKCLFWNPNLFLVFGHSDIVLFSWSLCQLIRRESIWKLCFLSSDASRKF